MKIFGFNITRSSRSNAPTLRRSLSSSAADWLAGRDIDHGSTSPLLSNAYQQVPWVYRAINVLAEQIANIPFLFSSGERGRETLITSGPLHDFYARPHPYINRFQYWELRIMWLMLRGECFRVPIYEDLVRTQSPASQTPSPISPPTHSALSRSTLPHSDTPAPRRHLSRVLILDPSHFHHIIEDHKLIGWRYTGFGPRAPLASQVFLPEEVWFEKLPNPFDFWRGLAPLYVADMARKNRFRRQFLHARPHRK